LHPESSIGGGKPNTGFGNVAGTAFDGANNAKEILDLPFDGALANNGNLGIQPVELRGRAGFDRSHEIINIGSDAERGTTV
jgi:hypothetical protein